MACLSWHRASATCGDATSNGKYWVRELQSTSLTLSPEASQGPCSERANAPWAAGRLPVHRSISKQINLATLFWDTPFLFASPGQLNLLRMYVWPRQGRLSCGL